MWGGRNSAQVMVGTTVPMSAIADVFPSLLLLHNQVPWIAAEGLGELLEVGEAD